MVYGIVYSMGTLLQQARYFNAARQRRQHRAGSNDKIRPSNPAPVHNLRRNNSLMHR
jgi:hypothetical protein